MNETIEIETNKLNKLVAFIGKLFDEKGKEVNVIELIEKSNLLGLDGFHVTSIHRLACEKDKTSWAIGYFKKEIE